MKDLSGRTIGMWFVVKLSHTARRSDVRKRVRPRHYWAVECTNCRSQRILEEHNMNPPSGGRCQNCWGRLQGRAGLNVLLNGYRRAAKKAGRAFDLSTVEFQALTSSTCHYCQVPPYCIRRGGKRVAKSVWGNYLYNGIDRVDNTMGYVAGNCVPCCEICNRAKRAMSYDDFMTYIMRIKNSGGN